MKIRHIETTIEINRPIVDVFRYFCRPENLNDITPPFLDFTILTPTPVVMQQEARIDYKLRLFGVPFRWQTLIHQWQPPFYFKDQQARGPYKLWRHDHFFEEKDGKVIMVDKIEYAIPGGIFEPLIYHLFVKHWLKKILSYRTAQTIKIFS